MSNEMTALNLGAVLFWRRFDRDPVSAHRRGSAGDVTTTQAAPSCGALLPPCDRRRVMRASLARDCGPPTDSIWSSERPARLVRCHKRGTGHYQIHYQFSTSRRSYAAVTANICVHIYILFSRPTALCIELHSVGEHRQSSAFLVYRYWPLLSIGLIIKIVYCEKLPKVATTSSECIHIS